MIYFNDYFGDGANIGTSFHIIPSKLDKGNVTGILGNYDENPANDMIINGVQKTVADFINYYE